MEKDGWHVTKKILNITLEIIYLLTGEDYTEVKKISSELTTPSVLQGWSGMQSPIMDNEQKILELTRKIIELLTGEVPLRYQDAAVYLSMEEWEYLEEHKDLYKDVMMKDTQPFTLPDEANETTPAERCVSTLCYQDCPEDIRNIPQEHQGTEVSTCCKVIHLLCCILIHDIIIFLFTQDEGLIDIKAEVRKREEETYRNSDHLCKEEETPTYINKDGHYSSIGTWDTCLDLPQYCKIEDNNEADSIERPITPIKQQDLPSVSSNSEECSNMTDILKPSAVRRNYKTFQCTECCKTFSQNADLIRHSRVHTGERPFLCTECGKCFTQKSALVYHKRIHTGERPFPCFDCGKCFAHKSILINHRRVHTGEKPFSCADCGKCFAYKSYLIDHQRIHTGVKPHHCVECRKCFTHKSDLNRHRRVHTGEKPFFCAECGRRFAQRANLAIHQKSHLQKQFP